MITLSICPRKYIHILHVQQVATPTYTISYYIIGATTHRTYGTQKVNTTIFNVYDKIYGHTVFLMI